MVDLFGSINNIAQGVVSNGIKTVINQYNNLTSSSVRGFINKGSSNILSAIGTNFPTGSPAANAMTGVLTQGVASATSLFNKIITDQFTLKDVAMYSDYTNNHNIINSQYINSRLQSNPNTIPGSYTTIVHNDKTYPTHDFPAVHVNTLIDTVRESLINDSNELVNSSNNTILAEYQATINGRKPKNVDNSSTTKPRSYAMDLDGFFPKYNFLYIVKFNLNSDYSEVPTSFVFLVKKFDRPDVQVHNEIINFYNFRSPVQTKTEFQPSSMVFHDDNQGLSLSFFISYLNQISPITTQQNSTEFETNGLNFSKKLTSSYMISSASVTSVLSNIELYHVYDYGGKVDKFTFYRPQIFKFKLSDLDMADSSNGSEISMEFVYDSIYVESGLNGDIINELSSPSCNMNIQGASSTTTPMEGIMSRASVGGQSLFTGDIPDVLKDNFSASLTNFETLFKEPPLPQVQNVIPSESFRQLESAITPEFNNQLLGGNTTNTSALLSNLSNTKLRGFW